MFAGAPAGARSGRLGLAATSAGHAEAVDELRGAAGGGGVFRGEGEAYATRALGGAVHCLWGQGRNLNLPARPAVKAPRTWCLYCWPGRRMVDGKFGWLTASGQPCVSA